MLTKRQHYKTTRKAMLTLLYFSLNNKSVTEDDLHNIMKNEAVYLFKKRAQGKIDSLLNLGFIHRINDEIKLTLRGLFLIDKKEKTTENIMYGHVLKKAMDREEFKEIYIALLMKITEQVIDENIYMKPLRALKKRGLIDFTKERVWSGGTQIKLRKEV